MKKLARWLWLPLVVLFTAGAVAQEMEPRARVVFTAPELDQMLAPVALYPDSLLSQLLMAATYPDDVSAAARWSRDHDGLAGEEAVREAEGQPWDPSVVSMVAFPEILAMMDERRDWTERLGEAFLGQPDDVMARVQELRRRADASGHLRSTEEIVVERRGEDYVIEPPAPEVVYVPYYDPRVVYGDWWWPDYQPVYWSPWPGYRYYGGFGWGWGNSIFVGSGFYLSAFDWRHRYVRYSNYRPWYWRGDNWRSGYRWTRDHRRDDRWRDRFHGGDSRWRDRDHGSDRWRDRNGDRDGRRRDGDRDRRGDRPDRVDRGDRGQYRERAITRPNYQRDDTQRRRQGGERASVNPAAPAGSAPSAAGGFFAPQPQPQAAPAPRSQPLGRPNSPRYSNENARPERRAAPSAPVASPPRNPVSRPVPQARTAPAPQVHAPAPQRSAPSAPVERSAPAPQSRAIERSSPRESSAPAPSPRGERSSGRNGFVR